jgi:pSer/pThr/pTyr-binding forkhead associated (FHA) protein
MSKLTLQFDGIGLREFAVGSGLTIGRLPDNKVVIDNPAVSGHHARIVLEGSSVVIEDLNSTNGTFVHGRPVTRHVLQHGDEVLIGKHQLAFDATGTVASVSSPALQGLGDTVYLDTKQHRALRAGIASAKAEAMRAAESPRPPMKAPAPVASSARRVGVLRVMSGRSEHIEYELERHTSLIGRSATAQVRLQGWFKPYVAVAIARSGDSYVATLLGGRTQINNQPLAARHELKDGDILNVSGLTLEFRWKDAEVAVSAA